MSTRRRVGEEIPGARRDVDPVLVDGDAKRMAGCRHIGEDGRAVNCSCLAGGGWAGAWAERERAQDHDRKEAPGERVREPACGYVHRHFSWWRRSAKLGRSSPTGFVESLQPPCQGSAALVDGRYEAEATFETAGSSILPAWTNGATLSASCSRTWPCSASSRRP